MTEAEKFVPIRKLAESGFLTESRLRKMHKQGKLPGIWCGKKFLVNVPLLNEELDRESKKPLSGGGLSVSRAENAPGNQTTTSFLFNG